jgi:phosphoglycolate phosphatase
MPVVLFDLDGTLTDPKLGITRCIAYALESLDVPVPDADALTSWIGPPIHDSFQVFFGDPDSERAARAVEKFRERFTGVGIYENSVYEGIPEALAELRANGSTLILATSKPQPFAERILDHFDLAQYFNATYGSRFDGGLSNKADLIAHILTTESIDPVQAIMVGDRKHDVIGASQNNVSCVGVLYGYGTREELIEAGAAALCESPRYLSDSVESCFRSKDL